MERKAGAYLEYILTILSFSFTPDIYFHKSLNRLNWAIEILLWNKNALFDSLLVLEWSFCPAGLHHWWTICSHFLAPRLSILSKLVDRDSYHSGDNTLWRRRGSHPNMVFMIDGLGWLIKVVMLMVVVLPMELLVIVFWGLVGAEGKDVDDVDDVDDTDEDDVDDWHN